MKVVWLFKVASPATGKIGLLPADEGALKIVTGMAEGEALPFRAMRVRDPIEHRRYWALMTLCAENCERIELPQGGTMLVHSKDDVHTAIKLCTGYYDTIFDAHQKPVAFIPKSTSFEEMTGDEWIEYWPRVTEVICDRIMPSVQLIEVEQELMKCMRLAA